MLGPKLRVFEEKPGRRSAAKFTKDEARRIGSNDVAEAQMYIIAFQGAAAMTPR
jgi:hypothetical protein